LTAARKKLTSVELGLVFARFRFFVSRKKTAWGAMKAHENNFCALSFLCLEEKTALGAMKAHENNFVRFHSCVPKKKLLWGNESTRK
jgi:hypothetical protein